MIKEHMFVVDCTGDVVVGDFIMFSESVFSGSFRKPVYVGERRIAAFVKKDSYGEAKQQHTFTLQVFDCDGVSPFASGEVIRRKGRNVYRNGTRRTLWLDESKRDAALDEKHARGAFARHKRQLRVGV